MRDSFQNTNAVSPSIFGNPLGGSLLGAGPESARNQNAGIGHSWQISPYLVNEIRLGLNRQTTAPLRPITARVWRSSWAFRA